MFRTDIRTDFYPYMLCIGGRELKTAKELKPRSEKGVHVIFRFGISKKMDGKPQHFIGLCDVWNVGYGSDDSKELPSCVEIPDEHGQELHPKDFLERWKVSRSDSNFLRIVETFLGHPGRGKLDALICDQLLYDFCKSYKPRVELVPVGTPGQPMTVEVRVRFFRSRAAKFIYIFTLKREQAETLFVLPQ